MSTQEYSLVWPDVSVSVPELDPAQRAAVELAAEPGCGPVLVLAGPGTGKTTTLVEAVAARVAAGTAPERILVLTFSRKAAQELRSRLGARLSLATRAPLAWTFHGFCAAVLTELAEHGGLGGHGGLDEAAGGPPTLLSGPEQDVAVRELVAGGLEDGRADWPPELAAALGTRGFADELRRLIARARSLGLDPDQLAAASDRADWRSAARFFEEYLSVLDARGALDYAELVLRAQRWLAGPAGAAIRERYDLVLVDEYQDTDPAQEQLLRTLAGQGRDLVVVGDPDQSIYAFRGADVRNILRFPERFTATDGTPARVLPLTVGRRSGPALLAASRAVAARLPAVAGVGARLATAHRELVPVRPEDPAETVEVLTCAHESVEGALIADLLRREHLEKGRPWSSMAVVVRSVAVAGARLRRALVAAGVPVEVAADELPLGDQPAVRPMLAALQVAVALAGRADPSADADSILPTELAHELLLSPLGGLDATAVRRLGRALRAEHLAGEPAHPVDLSDAPSAVLVRDALLDPRVLVGVEPAAADSARRLARLLRSAADLVAVDAPAYDVLWSIWSATSWPTRLERTARRGGAAGRAADSDLDAVLALFDVAARHDEQLPGRGVANLHQVLAAQQVPGDTLAERGVRPGGVRLVTAHRSKGLEWDLVVVAGVQDELWPDLRRRGSLLHAERLGPSGLEPPTSAAELLHEERRLFYVAITRARSRLVVTAVDSALEDGLRPSRFLDELGVEPQHVDRAPRRALHLRALVAELRRTAADPAASDALRGAAVARLAALADAEHGGRALVPAADPRRWWGTAAVTRSDEPFVRDGEPVALSGSVLQGIGDCPARWALSREVRGEAARGSAMGFGSIVHALADAVARGALPADLDTVMARLDEVWARLEFEAPWQRDLEREQARGALRRFLTWHEAHAAAGREPLATEAGFVVELDLDLETAGEPRSQAVRLRGSIDRIDRDADGRLVVVDLKTGRHQPTGPQVRVDPQLGAYQLAVESGGLAEQLGATEPTLGGAELVQLREERKGGLPQVQGQPELRAPAAGREDRDWVEQLLAAAAGRIVREDFPAVPGDACETCSFVAACPTKEAGRQVIQ